jgi:hypothetical protein
MVAAEQLRRQYPSMPARRIARALQPLIEEDEPLRPAALRDAYVVIETYLDAVAPAQPVSPGTR